MKKMFKLCMFIAVASALLFSCSLEKRHYSRGYYIDWKHNHHSSGGEGMDESVINNTKPEAELKKADVNEVTNKETTNTIQEETVISNIEVENNVSTPVNNVTENRVVEQKNVVSKNVSPARASKSKIATFKQAKKAMKSAGKGGPSKGLLIVLCFLIPWLAVGLATDWEAKPIIFNLLWSLTCIGGIIHAIIVVNREA